MSQNSTFAKRQYPYSHPGEARKVSSHARAPLAAGIYRFHLGLDSRPEEIRPEALEKSHNDPFAQLVLTKAQLPLTLREVLKSINDAPADKALPEQRSYLVSDGGQIPWSPDHADVDRAPRFVITRGVKGQMPAVLISTGPDLNDKNDPFGPGIPFLQVIGWDADNGAFQFYEQRDNGWVWAGSSWEALVEPTRGQGCFDSHVNGAVNMKELKFPWINWHSEAADIDGALAPDAPLRKDPIWANKSEAQDFEKLVARPGVDLWTKSRFDRCIVGGRLTRLPEFFRQVLDTSTVNLLTSPTKMSDVLADTSPVQIPATFFFNSDALVDDMKIDTGHPLKPSVPAAIYLEVLKKFDVALSDGKSFRADGDTFFVFLFPEPAFEDNLIAKKLREIGVMSDKLAASMLMVDFCNPVFSGRRAKLLAYVPADASVGTGSDFQKQFLAALQASPDAKAAGTPEAEFLELWSASENSWKADFGKRIGSFLDAITPKLNNAADFADLFRLVESRRREFRKRPLSEFALTTPVTNIPKDAALLEFDPRGNVKEK